MANAYTQVYIHVVFAVKYREPLLRKDFRDELFRYICGIVRNKKNRVLAINGVDDHVHILLTLGPTTALADLVRDIKMNSSSFINERRWTQGVFRWQEGYGAFSCSPDHVTATRRYIKNQEAHHRSREMFREEYLRFLKDYEI